VFRFNVSCLLFELIFLCGYVKCSMLYKVESLRLIIFAHYLWEMALNVDVDAPGKKCGRKQVKLIVRKLI
jgi:hypothetical protein